MIDEYKAKAAPLTLTQENHPENRPEAALPAPPGKSSLFRTIVISAFAGLIGMAYGVTALSSTLVLNEPGSFFSMLPLVAALVVIVTGWVGSMIWMCSSEGSGDSEA